jgi:hypothetical protein
MKKDMSDSISATINAILDADTERGEDWDDGRKIELLSEAIRAFEREASAAACERVKMHLRRL